MKVKVMLIKLDFVTKIKSMFCNKNKIKRMTLIYFFIATFSIKFDWLYKIGQALSWLLRLTFQIIYSLV